MAPALDGRVAAITGASSGIGEATALELARAGAAVALGARRHDRLDTLAQRIRGEGGHAVAMAVDVTDAEQARSFVDRASHELGGALDILVNNAGAMLLGPVQDASLDDWRRMVDVNVYGLLYCTHAALPRMSRTGGDIVNVSSVAGRRADAGAAVYNLTKFGVTGFSEALRKEVLHAGIRVTCVEPGMVETELQGHNQSRAVRQAMDRALERIGTPLSAQDVARAIVYVVSQPAHVSLSALTVRPTGQRD